jgi:hypothetical protein
LAQEGEKMLKHHFVRSAVRLSVLGLIGMGLAAADVQTSFANCLGHCQVMKRCADLVKEKGVKAG